MKQSNVSMEKGEDMTYVCEVCGFLFCRAGAAEECPFCEKNRIRPGTKEEIQRLQSILEQESSKVNLLH